MKWDRGVIVLGHVSSSGRDRVEGSRVPSVHISMSSSLIMPCVWERHCRRFIVSLEFEVWINLVFTVTKGHRQLVTGCAELQSRVEQQRLASQGEAARDFVLTQLPLPRQLRSDVLGVRFLHMNFEEAQSSPYNLYFYLKIEKRKSCPLRSTP